MPEIRSEIPTNEELRQYLLASFPTVAEDFTFRCPDSLRDHEEFLALAALGFNDFWQQASAAIFRSLQRLNGLPRDDTFWHNSNHRPTIFKLKCFCKEVLAEEPRDPVALWTCLALDVFQSANNFGQDQWYALREVGPIDAKQPVYAALFTELNAAPTASALAVLLSGWDDSSAEGLLLTMKKSGSERISRWSADVLTLLDRERGRGLTVAAPDGVDSDCC